MLLTLLSLEELSKAKIDIYKFYMYNGEKEYIIIVLQ